MVEHLWRLQSSTALALLVLCISITEICLAQTVINMIPGSQSGETNQNSEPNLSVNPTATNQMAASGLIFGDEFHIFRTIQGVCPSHLSPVFISTNSGDNWRLNCIVPVIGLGLSPGPGDTRSLTVGFSRSNRLYASIVQPLFGEAAGLTIFRTDDFLGATPMQILLEQKHPVYRPHTQSWVEATTVGGDDRVYVGYNDLALLPDFGGSGRTATIEQSLDAAVTDTIPMFDTIRVETRDTGSARRDGPVRLATAFDQKVYGAFFGWRKKNATQFRTDVVVVREDDGGTDPDPFKDLTDSDGNSGKRVVSSIKAVPEGLQNPLHRRRS